MDAVWRLCVVKLKLFTSLMILCIFAYTWRCMSMHGICLCGCYSFLKCILWGGDKENSNDSFSTVSIFVTVNVFERIESLAQLITIQMEFLKKFSLFRLQKKASPTVQGSVKSPLAIDSDISNIESKWKRLNISWIPIFTMIRFWIAADNTLLTSGFDTTLDTSYQNQNPNATFGDLLSGFGGLGLNTPQRKCIWTLKRTSFTAPDDGDIRF